MEIGEKGGERVLGRAWRRHEVEGKGRVVKEERIVELGRRKSK